MRKIKIVLVAFIAGLMLVGCGSKRDVTHDPDGFLGYSDSFWEWYGDNN